MTRVIQAFSLRTPTEMHDHANKTPHTLSVVDPASWKLASPCDDCPCGRLGRHV